MLGTTIYNRFLSVMFVKSLWISHMRYVLQKLVDRGRAIQFYLTEKSPTFEVPA